MLHVHDCTAHTGVGCITCNSVAGVMEQSCMEAYPIC